MKMVANQYPGVTPGFVLASNLTQAIQEIVAIPIIAENLPTLDAAYDNVV